VEPSKKTVCCHIIYLTNMKLVIWRYLQKNIFLWKVVWITIHHVAWCLCQKCHFIISQCRLCHNFSHFVMFVTGICYVFQTLSMSYWAATISAFHNTHIVIMTFGLVTVVCLGISLFSVQTKASEWALSCCILKFFFLISLFSRLIFFVLFWDISATFYLTN
jgi:hypothetical protein